MSGVTAGPSVMTYDCQEVFVSCDSCVMTCDCRIVVYCWSFLTSITLVLYLQ